MKPGDFIIILKETEITNSDGHPFTRNPGELYEVMDISQIFISLKPVDFPTAENRDMLVDFQWFTYTQRLVWDLYDEAKKLQAQPMPKNNDGRATCAWCGAPTRVWMGLNAFIQHNVCTVCKEGH